MKYDVATLLEVVVYPNDATLLGGNNQINTNEALANYVSMGYEVYKAIPLTTANSALIKYILRRERKEKDEK